VEEQKFEVVALTGMQVLGLYVALPALLFGAIALVVLLVSRLGRQPTETFPRLRPAEAPVNNSGLYAGRPQAPGSGDPTSARSPSST
jgi:hypothetical protein